ncbi:MAG: glycosyltransferase family 4 protein [Paracoccaceae bacterium]
MGYIWSPLAPSPSGIANYVETLIAPAFEDVTFVTKDPSQRQGRRAIAPGPEAWDAQNSLLQVGNNVYHDFILNRAQAGDAVIELHDLSLHHLHTEMTLARKDFAGYLSVLEACEGRWGRKAAFQRQKGFYTPRLDFYMRANKLVCDRARAIIVHSRWARYQIELQGVETPVHVIPHYALPVSESHTPFRNKAEARAHLGLDQDRFVILSAGYVTPAKRIDWVLDAFEVLRNQGADVQLVIAGACEMEPISDRVRTSRHANRIRITGYLDDADFDTYTLAADALPLMRFPSAGESSGVAARALGFGRLIIVPEYAAFSDLPDAICEKIHLDQAVVPQLVDSISRYTENPGDLTIMEARAKSYAETFLSLDQARTDLAGVLDKYWI